MQTDLHFGRAINSLINKILPTTKSFAIIAKDNIDKYKQFITFRRDSITTLTSKDRLSHTATARYTINFFAKTYADSIDIAQTFIDSVDNQQDTIDGYAFTSTVTDVSEDYDDTYQLYIQSMSVEFEFFPINSK